MFPPAALVHARVSAIQARGEREAYNQLHTNIERYIRTLLLCATTFPIIVHLRKDDPCTLLELYQHVQTILDQANRTDTPSPYKYVVEYTGRRVLVRVRPR